MSLGRPTPLALLLIASLLPARAWPERRRGDAELGREAFLAGWMWRAFGLLSQAYSAGDRSVGLRLLLARSAAAVETSTIRLEGHADGAHSVVFSPDGRWLATAGNDPAVKLWNARTGQYLFTLPGSTFHAQLAGVFAPDSTRFVTIEPQSAAWISDVDPSLDPVELAGHTARVESASFSPDGRRVVTAGIDGTARIFDATSSTLVATLAGHTGPVHTAAFSPDGRHVVTASEDLTARIWNASTGALVATLAGSAAPLRSAAFSPDGERVITLGAETTTLWAPFEPGGPRVVARLPTQNRRHGARPFSPDGHLLATVTGPELGVQLWDARDGKPVRRGPRVASTSMLAFGPDGRTLAIATTEGTVVCDPQTGAVLGTIPSASAAAVALGPDGAHIASALSDGTVRVVAWPLDLPVETASLRTESHHAVFSPDSRTLATVGPDAVRIWTVGGVLQRTIPGSHWRVLFAPDGRDVVTVGGDPQDGARLLTRDRHLAAYSDGESVYVEDQGTGTGKRLFTLDMWQISAAAFSADGTRLVTGSEGGAVHVWEGSSGRPLGVLRGGAGGFVEELAISKDRRLVAARSRDGGLALWQLGTRKLVMPLAQHTAGGGLPALAFSPDAALLAYNDLQGVVVVETASGTVVARLGGSDVLGLAFSHDGRWLAATTKSVTYLHDVHLEDRPPKVVAEIARCRLPFVVQRDKLRHGPPPADCGRPR